LTSHSIAQKICKIEKRKEEQKVATRVVFQKRKNIDKSKLRGKEGTFIGGKAKRGEGLAKKIAS